MIRSLIYQTYVTTRYTSSPINHKGRSSNGEIPEVVSIRPAMTAIERMCKNWSTKYGATTHCGLTLLKVDFPISINKWITVNNKMYGQLRGAIKITTIKLTNRCVKMWRNKTPGRFLCSTIQFDCSG